MSYYYDWVAQKWMVRSKPTAAQKSRRDFRRGLIADLLTEIENGDSIASLYALMLARTLVTTDPALMDAYGQRVTEIGNERTCQVSDGL